MQLLPQGGLHLGGCLRHHCHQHSTAAGASKKVPALRLHSPVPSSFSNVGGISSSCSSSSPIRQGVATHYSTSTSPATLPSSTAAPTTLPSPQQTWEWSEKHEPSKQQAHLCYPSSNGDQPSMNGGSSSSSSSSSTANTTATSAIGNGTSSSSRPPGLAEQRHSENGVSWSTPSSSTTANGSSSNSSGEDHSPSTPSTSYIALDAPRPVSPSSRTSFVYYGDDYEPILSSGVPMMSAKRMQELLSPAAAAAAATSLDAAAQSSTNGSSASDTTESDAAASVTAAAAAAAAAATAAAPVAASTSGTTAAAAAATTTTIPGLAFDPATPTSTSPPSPTLSEVPFPIQPPLPPTPGTLPPFPVLPQGITAESILHPPPSTDPLALPSLEPTSPPTDAATSHPEPPAPAAANTTTLPNSTHAAPLQPASASTTSTAAAAASSGAAYTFADPRPRYRWPSGVERDGPPSWLEQAQQQQQQAKERADSGQGGPTPEALENFAKLWALLVLSATYVHQASTGYSIPIMMPMISTSLSLTDFQGAMLTSGYSYLYALALIPAGIMADKGNRPRLLGLSALAWSGFSALSSQASTFSDLMVSRVGLATAQSSQNVICFSMIPDLFPKNKSLALAVYNSAIYVGRGLMFVLLTGVRSVMFPTQPVGQDGSSAMSVISHQVVKDASGNLLVPLDKIDLRLVQIMYTTGDMAAIRSISPFDLTETTTVVDQPWINEQMWRTVLEWVAFPGFLLGAAMLLTVSETRKPFLPPQPHSNDTHNKGNEASSSSAASGGADVSTSGISSGSGNSAVLVSASGGAAAATSLPVLDSQSAAAAAAAEAAAAAAARVEDRAKDVIPAEPAGWAGVALLLKNSAFMSTTIAAALNDVASYALVAWQSTFYERVYGLSTDQYAPVLATILPIAGILGGVGGGALADKLSQSGKRGVVTVGASLLAAPFIWASFMADNPTESFAALGVGFALSESWRAPAAVMARSVAPPSMSSTASAIYLSVRNIIGGLGPLAVAQLATIKDLRSALELLPLMYLLSGATFSVAERKLNAVKAQQLAVSQAQAAAAEVQQAAEQVMIEHGSSEGGGISSSSFTSKASDGSPGSSSSSSKERGEQPGSGK